VRPYFKKKIHHKKGLVEWHKVQTEFKPQHYKKKKKKKMLSVISVPPNSKVAAGENGSAERTAGTKCRQTPSFSPVFS
jgi:hypothetical protein